MTSYRSCVALALLFVPACTPAMRSGTPAPRPDVSQPVVIERLYLGRNVADTLLVTDSAWLAFVTEVVTPRFPAGLTVWSAMGQWRDAAGRIAREPSFVLEIVHPASAGDTGGIATIVAEYKRRFRQETVLWVVTPARVVSN